MQELTIALAQINPTVGALADNAARILGKAQEATSAGADIVVLPELALSGYPPEDLVLKQRFLRDAHACLEELARALPPDLVVIAGSPLPCHHHAANSAAILHNGTLVDSYAKMVLPNYGVFDEYRHFTAGRKPLVLCAGPYRFGLHICEDSWRTDLPATRLLEGLHLDALINLSASPYARGKTPARLHALRQTAAALHTRLLYCNLVGGQDELVFEGASLVLGADGCIQQQAAAFQEDLLYVTLPTPPDTSPPPIPEAIRTIHLPPPSRPPRPVPRKAPPGDVPPPTSHATHTSATDTREVYTALTLGLRDYANKNRFQRVVVALSGGIDSALVLALAYDALGAGRVVAITMPSPYTSDETLRDARAMADLLDIELHTLPIHAIYDEFLRQLTAFWPDHPPDTTEENIQARIRGALIMAFSNKFGWLVLTTGNKSELATGYCTLYGDMAGGLAVLKDVPKTLVFELSIWRNQQEERPVIPPTIIARPPSAELRANQLDSDSLPPYPELDAILELYIEQDLSLAEIIAHGHNEDTARRVIRLVDLNEYKRRQAPPGIKITPKAFGRDRRMPITNRYAS